MSSTLAFVCSTAQLLERDVALHLVPGLDLDERRLGHLADALHERGGSACGRRSRWAGWPDSGSRPRGGSGPRVSPSTLGHGRQERLGVRVVGPAEDRLRIADLHDPPEVHDRDPVGEVAHDAKVVRDQQVAGLALGLQLGQDVQDRGLDRDVERTRRLVGDDDAGVAGERAGDRHALLEPARQLARLEVQVALGETAGRRPACRRGRRRPCP